MKSIMTKETRGACDVLNEEQRCIMEYFREFDDAESPRRKKAVGDESLRAIEVVIDLEEELFYPAVRRSLGERQRVVQALAANQVAKLLIKELKALPAGEQYNARFELLKENLAQHFESLGVDLFPRVDRSSMDLEGLGRDLIQLKTRLARARFGMRRKVAGVAAGVAAIGTAVWLARRESARSR